VLPQGGGIAVSAPLRTGDAEISRFVLSREDWIERQIERQGSLARAALRTGTSCRISANGSRCGCCIEPGASARSERATRWSSRSSGRRTRAARRKAVDAWYRAELYEAAGAMLPAIERTVGKRAGELRVARHEDPLGTCNTKTANITLNLRLAQRPAEAFGMCSRTSFAICTSRAREHFWRRMDEYYPTGSACESCSSAESEPGRNERLNEITAGAKLRRPAVHCSRVRTGCLFAARGSCAAPPARRPRS
jgi:predicted metal-dependent hydrolase